MTVTIVCPHCSFSKSLPEEKIPPGVKSAVCPRCRQRFEIAVSKVQTKPAPGSRVPSPWESRPILGLTRGFGESVKGVLFSPSTFFRTAAVDGGIREPLAFGVLAGSLGIMFEVFWQALSQTGEFPALSGIFGAWAWGPALMGVMVLSPLAVTIFVCLTSLVLHVLLVIVRGGRNGFEATFRAVSYAQATQLWAVLPLIGSFLAAIWLLVVQIIGLKEMHGVSAFRVFLAMLIPFVLLGVAIAAALASFLFHV